MRNDSFRIADKLARRGHDVDTVLDEQLGGRKDPVVVQAATDDDRMVITLDRGVGAPDQGVTGSAGP